MRLNNLSEVPRLAELAWNLHLLPKAISDNLTDLVGCESL